MVNNDGKWCTEVQKESENGAKKIALGAPAGGRQDNQSSAHLFAIDWTICLQNGPVGPSAAMVPYLIWSIW